MIEIDRKITGNFHQPKCFFALFKSFLINPLQSYTSFNLKAPSGKTCIFIPDLTGKQPGGSIIAPLIQKGDAKGIHILNM